jgi:molybdenum cofactor cytidylyltransferase
MQIAAIYMASGFGRRFGSNKLLYNLKGKPLYQHGFEQLQVALERLQTDGVCLYRLVVVSQYDSILDWTRQQGAVTQRNMAAAEGICASLRAGIEAAGAVDAYAFFVADQPFLQAATIAGFLSGFATSGKALGRVCSKGVFGNPTVFSQPFKAELLGLHGDRGGSIILRRHPEQVWSYKVQPEELRDIDTLENLWECREK